MMMMAGSEKKKDASIPERPQKPTLEMMNADLSTAVDDDPVFKLCDSSLQSRGASTEDKKVEDAREFYTKAVQFLTMNQTLKDAPTKLQDDLNKLKEAVEGRGQKEPTDE